MKRAFILFLIILTGHAFVLHSQNQDTIIVHLKTRVGEHSVKLRWMVEKPHLWKMMNHRGFIIERYTDVKEGQTPAKEERKLLTPTPLKAATLDEWAELGSQNPYAAVIAQAIYGETFEVTGLKTGDIAEVIQLSQESEQRYSFALYAADMCFEAACLAGWGYEDKEVNPDECYLYRIIPLETGDLPFQYGFDYVCMNEYQVLPTPLDLKAEFGDKTVSLTWNGSIMKTYFTSYQIEKSEDNQHFEALSMPVTSLNEETWGYSSFVDSLAVNDRTYYYRIKGISPFGEISEPSDTVQGQGKSSLKFFPKITRSVINELGQAEIEWEFDPAGEPSIDFFSLERSPDGNEQYEMVVESIRKNERMVVTNNVHSSNYFAVSAVSSGGNCRSHPVLLMPQDSIPPVAPIGLSAEVDTLGVVRLQWIKNKEPDVLGYKVFRGYRVGDELVAAHTIPIDATVFTDTVDLYNLNEFICYQVVAFDQHYNQSSPSSVLKVTKPLRVQPAPPVLTGCRSGEEGIQLNWENNSDDWVTKHVLYRQHKDSIKFSLLREFSDLLQTSFTDSMVEKGINYTYTLTAVSRWGIESNPCPGLSIVASGRKSECIMDFQIRSDRERKQVVLSWKTAEPEKISIFKIYRATNDNRISLWQELPGNANQTLDNTIQVGGKYRYLIYAVLNNGSISNPKEKTITY